MREGGGREGEMSVELLLLNVSQYCLLFVVCFNYVCGSPFSW